MDYMDPNVLKKVDNINISLSLLLQVAAHFDLWFVVFCVVFHKIL